MSDFVVDVILWVDGLPPWLQIGALFLLGMIPFIESYLGGPIGMVLGINPFVAVPAAILGNIVCVFLIIYIAGRARDAATRSRQSESEGQSPKRRRKVEKLLNRFGVPGVMLSGFFTLPSQFSAPILVSVGAKRRSVYIWTAIAVIVWGVIAGLIFMGILGGLNYEYLDYQGV